MKKYLIYYIAAVLCLLGLSRLTWGTANNGVFQMVYFLACLVVVFLLQALVRRALLSRVKRVDEGAYRSILRRMSGQRTKGEATGALAPDVVSLLRWWSCCKVLSAALVILAVALLGLTFL